MKILIPVLFWFCITIVYASELNIVNLNDKLTNENIEQSINSIILLMKDKYLFPEKALLVENELRYILAENNFETISDWYSFIDHIGIVLRNISGDMYLDIVETKPSFMLASGTNKNVLKSDEAFGIKKIDVLLGNVGYLKLDHFYQNSEAEIEIYRALEKLSEVDALIIDLRDAEGESILLAQYFMSFFVEKNTVLTEVLYDKRNKKKILRTIETHGSDKFKHNFPVYILTSPFLSSSGELLSYTLKHLGKAVIVGEETMGVAYILNKQKINDHISLTIPVATYIHPVTKINWAKTGVIPNLKTTVELSLGAAHKKAKEYLGIF